MVMNLQDEVGIIQTNQIETHRDDQCDTDKGNSKLLFILWGALGIIDIRFDLFVLEITPKRWCTPKRW